MIGLEMTRRRAVLLVMRREIVERTRQRSFRISSALMLAAVLALAILPGILADDGPSSFDVGVVGSTQRPLMSALERIEIGTDVEMVPRSVANRSEAERLLADGTLHAAIDGDEVVVEEDLADQLAPLVQLANREVRAAEALAEAGLSAGEAEAITNPPPLRTVALDPTDPADEDKRVVVFFGVIAVYGLMLMYCQAVASSVVEEKSSRVVELVLGKMRPTDLLTGKIVSVGLLGFVQLVVLVVAGLAAAIGSGTLDPPPGLAGAATLLVIWFVIGYAFYSALFAMAGTIASRVEELQNTLTPAMFLVIGGIFAASFAAQDPGGAFARSVSFIPPSAPFVMPIRSSAGEAAVWEILVSVALVLVAIVAVVRLAARLYGRGGALRTGGQVSFREAWSTASRS